MVVLPGIHACNRATCGPRERPDRVAAARKRCGDVAGGSQALRAPRFDVAGFVGPRFALAAGMRPRILIVDDEPNARSALAELLRDEGYEVASVADGLSAKSRIAEFRPDVLITDLH